MKGDPKVIAVLQAGFVQETHLNIQYRSDQREVKFFGAKKTARKLKQFGNDAHEWMKEVKNRLLFLEANAGFTEFPPITSQSTVTAVLEAELALEMKIIAPYEQAIQVCMKALDDTSRNLFEHLLKWHEKHVEWLERQLRLIGELGEAEYVAEKL